MACEKVSFSNAAQHDNIFIHSLYTMHKLGLSPNCLQRFKHTDLVSCIAFHPSDDRYFVTGCFDKVLRLWDSTKDSEPLRFKEVKRYCVVWHFTDDDVV